MDVRERMLEKGNVFFFARMQGGEGLCEVMLKQFSIFWGWRDLNPHASHLATDFKSVASTNSATAPYKIIKIVYHKNKNSCFIFIFMINLQKKKKTFIKKGSMPEWLMGTDCKFVG